MAESKPLASLSAGLLARKGSARPAMRRQTAPGVGAGFHGHDDLGWNDMGYDVNPHHLAVEPPRGASHGLSPMLSSVDPVADDADAIEALANAVDRAMPEPEPVVSASVASIAADAPLPPATEEPPLVVRQRAMIADAVEKMDMPAPRRPQRSPAPRAQAGMRGNYAFTLRLDPDRHLRLRLASATSNRSAQQILIALVDEFLSTQPEIDAFAARLPANARC
jgi:hypothetical protein